MQRSVNSAAKFLDQHPLWRWAACLAAALCAVLLIGYHSGTFDHNVHFPFFKAAANPQLYPGDPFLALRSDQFSFFWPLLQPFLSAGVLEPTLFILHLAAVTLFMGSVWDVSMTLFHEPLAALFALFAFIVTHTGFVGFPLIEFSLQSRTFVLPFILMAVNLHLKNKNFWAILLLGVMFNLNLLMTAFALAMLLVGCLADLRRSGWRNLAVGSGAFLLGALPVLAWKFNEGSGLDLSLRSDWLSGVTQGGLHQIFYLFSGKPFLLLTLGGISALALFGIGRSAIASHDLRRKLDLYMLALAGLLVLNTLAVHLLPLTFLMQLQVNRASLFILVLAYITYAGYLAKSLLHKAITPGECWLLAGSLFVSALPILPLLAWLLHRTHRLRIPRSSAWAVAGLALVFGLQMLAALRLGLWQPGIHIRPRQDDWLEVQTWVRTNTPLDALFIAPPYMAGLYQADWRVYSERGSVASLYDLFEIALKPEYFPVWLERFSAIAPGAFERFNGIYFDNQTFTREAYNSLDAEQLLELSARYGAAYAVRDKETRLDLPLAYENGEYLVYRLAVGILND